jgi:hypothetical protein
VAALLAQIDLPSLSSEGPDRLHQLIETAFILLGVGFGIATIGHLVKVRFMVAVGTILILAAAAVFVVASLQYG